MYCNAIVLGLASRGVVLLVGSFIFTIFVMISTARRMGAGDRSLRGERRGTAAVKSYPGVSVPYKWEVLSLIRHAPELTPVG